MKVAMLMLVLTLVGCATKQEAQRSTDTRWSDYVHETMLKCGVVAGKIADGDGVLADVLYNQFLRDMNLTL